MKKVMSLCLTAVMLTALFCMPAVAEESSPHTIGGSVIFGTDYYYRGVSQTNHLASVQAELTYEHASGFYAGIWGGNIANHEEYVDDFVAWTYATNDTNVELDAWVGYWKELGPIELDLMAIYMHFPGSSDSGLVVDPNTDDWVKGEAESDYYELHIGLAHRFDLPLVPKLSVGYDWTPQYWGQDGAGNHVNAVLGLNLPWDLGLTGEAGYQKVDGGKQTGIDSQGYSYGLRGGYGGTAGFEYAYYRVGLDRDFFGINVDLSYHTNTESEWFGYEQQWWPYDATGYAAPADDRAILTISYAF